MDYHHLQFHRNTPSASVLRVIFVSRIMNGSETVSPSDDLNDSLSLCGTITSSLKFPPKSLITKAFFSVIIENLIVFRNGHKKGVA